MPRRKNRKAVKTLKQITKRISLIGLMQIALAFALILAPVAIPQVVSAQGFDIGTVIDDCPPGYRCDAGSLPEIFRLILTWALGIAFVAAVLILIYGGFLYITSAGNQDTATKGKNAILNALIGIVVIVLSYVIVQVVYRFIVGTS